MQSRKEHIHTALLEAAKDEFARKGMEKASLTAIAKAAGVSPGTVYIYFKDKRDLYDSCLPPSVAEELTKLADKGILNAGKRSLELLTVTRESHGPLIEFLLRNRREVLILAQRGEWKGVFVDFLQGSALEYFDGIGRTLTQDEARFLRFLYEGLLERLLAALRSGPANEDKIQKLIAYHVAGLKGVF